MKKSSGTNLTGMMTVVTTDEVNRNAINQWLFNADTVDKVLENLMANGIKVAGVIVLAKQFCSQNQRHAEFIFERFNLHYPLLAASGFARVITNQTKYSHTLIKDFGQPNKDPHIAISVDMLDTGIDVPECVNLVPSNWFGAAQSSGR